MAIVEVDKESDSIIFVMDDGKRSMKSVRKEDSIVSVIPSGTYRKVKNIYYNEATGKMVVVYAKA